MHEIIMALWAVPLGVGVGALVAMISDASIGW